ncbi:MAG: hypothetical protein D4R67_11750 [Bacteroidetes bacterium]|nr:MAG: hypothetical protein D4R67_11750 [Bacteroidota bacterium]
MKKRKLFYYLALTILWPAIPGFSQEEQILQDEEKASPGKVTLNVGADLVSRYIWRGIDFGNSAAIQPTLSVDAFGFSLGAWGSYAFSRHTLWLNDTASVDYSYTEIDLFLSYTYKYFTLMLVDYYAPIPVDTLPGINYFNWNNRSTWHTLEVSLILNGPDRFPIQFLAATLVYGADKGKDSTGAYGAGTQNNYSTYFELSYLFTVRGFGIRPFIGGIPFGSSWYGSSAGINNLGITVRKEIPVSKKFSIPVQSSLVFNPLSKKAFLVFTLSL